MSLDKFLEEELSKEVYIYFVIITRIPSMESVAFCISPSNLEKFISFYTVLPVADVVRYWMFVLWVRNGVLVLFHVLNIL